MTRTLTELPKVQPTSTHDSTNGHAPPMGSDVADAPKRRRVPPLLVGVTVGVVAFGAFVALTPLQPRSVPVLVVRSAVAQGGVITRSELGVVSLAVPKGLAVLPASAEATVPGSHASAQLAPGQLLATSDFTTAATNQARVGLALRAGQFPNDLAAGMRVAVLQAGANTTAPTVLAGDASVMSVAPYAGSPDGALVVLGVPTSAAGRVALAGPAGEAVLVALP